MYTTHISHVIFHKGTFFFFFLSKFTHEMCTNIFYVCLVEIPRKPLNILFPHEMFMQFCCKTSWDSFIQTLTSLSACCLSCQRFKQIIFTLRNDAGLSVLSNLEINILGLFFSYAWGEKNATIKYHSWCCFPKTNLPKIITVSFSFIIVYLQETLKEA